MTIVPKPPTVERPGVSTEKMGRGFLHLSGTLILIVPIAVLVAMLFLDHKFNVLDAIPLKYSPSSPFIDFLLVGTLAFPIGAGTLLYGLDDVVHALRSIYWPTTKGKVLTSEVEGALGKGPHFSAIVRFEYLIQGRRYESSTVHFAQRKFRLATSADDVVRSYPVGSEVTVHYDPYEPDTAVLETSPSDAYRAVLWGLGWLLFPFLAYFQFFRDFLHG